MISLLSSENTTKINEFSEKALSALNGFYVYALIDPRSNDVFYIGKGIGVFLGNDVGNKVTAGGLSYEVADGGA